MKFLNQKAIRDAILEPIFAVNPDLNIENITTRDEFALYLINAFPDMFKQHEDGKYYVAG